VVTRDVIEDRDPRRARGRSATDTLCSRAAMPFAFAPSYTSLPELMYTRVHPTPVPAPTLLAFNDELAAILGVTADELTSPEGLALLVGNRVQPGSDPIALGYAGHQFGNFVPRLGDGRAILLGEVIGTDGRRYDVQLKGAGPTPWSRGGDGRAAVGPVLREMVVSEAMHALGVPTTRALAAVATGARVFREQPLPGAVLTRVAASHLRIGTFEYVASRHDRDALARLVDYALQRHYPSAAKDENPALALLDGVVRAQAELVAKWLCLGFVHGVMNTDNMSISGETIDYGPCAFLDGFDPDRSFSSIDQRGRYAYANQPRIAMWNLARLAETLLPLVEGDRDAAIATLTARVTAFAEHFDAAYARGLRAKLGLLDARDGDLDLARAFLDELATGRVDFTLAFRRLYALAAGGDEAPLVELVTTPEGITPWLARWRARIADEGDAATRAEVMRTSNPGFIPRNHRIEEMIGAAVAGDLEPLRRLRRVLARPYDDQPAEADLAAPPGADQWGYRTFCGT
jgi:uncharacterized protein YdiU (UPF0061 family)